MWVKYKHNFAYGSDKKWTYIEIHSDEDYIKECYKEDGDDAIGAWLMHEERVGDDYAYSDKYRGIDWEKVDGLPPYEEISWRLENCKNRAKSYAEEAKRFQAMLDQIGTITKNDMEM